jgi:hypothetical protein
MITEKQRDRIFDEWLEREFEEELIDNPILWPLTTSFAYCLIRNEDESLH